MSANLAQGVREAHTTLGQCSCNVIHGCAKLHCNASTKKEAKTQAPSNAASTLKTAFRWLSPLIRLSKLAREIFESPKAKIQRRMLV